MRQRRRARCLTSWIACLGILMAALAPGISQALPKQSWWDAVCSADTLPSSLKAGLESGKSAPGHDLAQSHCPYCSLQAGTPVLPGAPLAFAAIPAVALASPAQRACEVSVAGDWPRARPRAPPRG